MAHGSDRALGMFLSGGARRYDAIRKPSGRFLDRLKIALTKKANPGELGVRGDWVAVDSLAEAFIRQGTMDRYELFTESDALESLRQTLESYPQGATGRVRIHSMDVLLRGMDKYSLTALLQPAGAVPEVLTMRKRFASQMHPVIAVSHGFSQHTRLYGWFLRILLTGTYPCDSMICTSRASQTAMANILEHVGEQFNREFNTQLKFAGRLDRIPLCVDTEKLKPRDKRLARRQFGLPKDALILLFLGRISPFKTDLLPLLPVFQSLIKENPRRELLMVIGGTKEEPYATSVQGLIKDLSLSKYVRLICDVSDEQKGSLLAGADIFVAPADSVQESFGLSPIEAMACGVPQVVADWDGYRDTVAHGETGFLVPTYWTECDRDLRHTGVLLGWQFDHLCLGQSVAVDVHSLQLHLQLLIENDQLRRDMSLRSRTRAESLYSFGVVVKQYEDLCTELSHIARGLTLHRGSGDFEKPRYFEFFRNHPSHVIGDDCPLALSALGGEAANGGISPLLTQPLVGFQIADAKLVRRILQEFKEETLASPAGHRASAKSVTLGELVRLLGEGQEHHPDYLRRNVMWLVKHGFVTADVGQAHEGRSRSKEEIPESVI